MTGFTEETKFDSQSDAIDYVETVKDHYKPLTNFIETYSQETLSELVELVPAYADGNMTYRAVANTVDAEYGDVFEAIAILTPLLVGRQESETWTPDSCDESSR